MHEILTLKANQIFFNISTNNLDYGKLISLINNLNSSIDLKIDTNSMNIQFKKDYILIQEFSDFNTISLLMDIKNNKIKNIQLFITNKEDN